MKTISTQTIIELQAYEMEMLNLKHRRDLKRTKYAFIAIGIIAAIALAF